MLKLWSVGVGFSPGVPDSSNGTPSEMKGVNVAPAARTGAQDGYKQVRLHGIGEGWLR